MQPYDYIARTASFASFRRSRTENRITLLLLTLVSIGAFTVMILFDGDVIPAISTAATIGIVVISLYRIDWGLCIFIGLVLSLDQFAIRGYETFTYKVSYFHNLNQNPYLPSLPSAVVSPMEIHLLFLVATWIVLLALRKEEQLQSIPVWFLFSLFMAWVVISLVRGLASGGDFIVSLWEIRAIGYFGIIYMLVPQIIRTKAQIETLLWFIIAGITLKAFQGFGRFVGNGLSMAGADLLTSAEDPVFMVTLILFLSALVFLGKSHPQRTALACLLLPLLAGIYSSQRRSCYASLAISTVGLVLLLPAKQRKVMLKGMVVLGVLFCIYLALYWNTYGRIGVIAQQFKSIIGQTNTELAGADYLSNLYRRYENFNLATTIQRAPLMGIGFGNPYDTPMTWFSMLERFSLLKYIPHDSLYWFLAKAGAIGFFFFCFFLNTFLFKVGQLFRMLKDHYLQAVCALALLAIINQIVVAYVEMQLTFYRNMIYLGCLMGLTPTLIALHRQDELQSIPQTQSSS